MIEIICFEIWLCARHCLKYLTRIHSFPQENTKIQGILICNLEDKGTEIMQFTEGHKASRWQSPNSSCDILAYHFSLRWVSKLLFERVIAHLMAFREYEEFPSSVLTDKEAERERWEGWDEFHSIHLPVERLASGILTRDSNKSTEQWEGVSSTSQELVLKPLRTIFTQMWSLVL